MDGGVGGGGSASAPVRPQREIETERESELESMAANDETLGHDNEPVIIRQGSINSSYGTAHRPASSAGAVSRDTDTGPSSSTATGSRSDGTSQTGRSPGKSPGKSPGNLKRVQSFYTPYMEDKLCRKLKFFFMGPHEKVKARRRCPWKLCIQIIKIVLVTLQVIQFGFSRFSLVEFIEKTTISMKHMYLKDWTNSYETMPYPPASGIYAIYHIEDIEKLINYAMKSYDETEKIAIGALKFFPKSKKDNTRKAMKMCVKQYRSMKISAANNTYEIDSHDENFCRDVEALANGTYNITVFLKEQYNFTIEPDRLLMITLQFPLKSFRLDFNDKSAGPQLFRVDVMIELDDSNQDGQMKVNLVTDVIELDASGKSADAADEKTKVIASVLLDGFVMFFTVLSIVLCSRSVLRGQLLKRETKVFFKNRFGKDLSLVDQCEFLNLWYVTIIINDILTLVGTGYKIQLETHNLRSSSSNYDICSIMLGTGSLLAWLGLLRYIGFFKQFNILIVTLKMAFPSMLRFLLCTLLLYFGFMICGWAVLGPYHIKFRHIYTASECLFSLVNGDDMFVTFSATVTNSNLIWYYSRIYLYGFISLYIYAVLNLFIAVILDSYETIKEYYLNGFPKSELFEFIDQCQEPAHHPIYRQEASSCDPLHLIGCCCCRGNPDKPNEYTSLVS